MARYRFYSITDNHISGVTELECRNDGDALEKGRALPGKSDIEIWDGARRLARIDQGGGARMPLRSAGNARTR